MEESELREDDFYIKVYPVEEFVYVKVWGELDKSGLENLGISIRQVPKYDFKYDGIFDMRSGTFAMDYSEYVEESRKTKELTKGMKVGKWAVLVQTPKESAYCQLWSEALENSYEDEIFCSLEGAAKFLQRKVSFLEDISEASETD